MILDLSLLTSRPVVSLEDCSLGGKDDGQIICQGWQGVED